MPNESPGYSSDLYQNVCWGNSLPFSITWVHSRILVSLYCSIFGFLCVLFCRSLFVPLFFYYCVVCPSLISGFWLLLWHLQTFLTFSFFPNTSDVEEVLYNPGCMVMCGLCTDILWIMYNIFSNWVFACL